MMTPIPPDLFTGELSSGEKIYWSGRPNPRVIFHGEDWSAVPFSLLWGGFAIFWTLGASAMLDIWRNKPDRVFSIFGLIWGVPFVLMGQYFIWGRFVHEHWKKKRTYYALTNRRALIVELGWSNRKSSSAYLDTLPFIDKRVRADGIGTLAFGAPVANKWRWGKGHPPPPPMFEDVDDVETVYQTTLRLFEEAKSLQSTVTRRWPEFKSIS